MGIFFKSGILHTLRFHLLTQSCHFWLNLYWHAQPGCKFNSLWPSDAIWWHRSWSTLARVIACCLMASGTKPITRTNVDLSSMQSSDNHLGTILWEISQPKTYRCVPKVHLPLIYIFAPAPKVHLPLLIYEQFRCQHTYTSAPTM